MDRQEIWLPDEYARLAAGVVLTWRAEKQQKQK